MRILVHGITKCTSQIVELKGKQENIKTENKSRWTKKKQKNTKSATF